MTSTLILAATVLAVTAVVCFAAARAWRGWLEYKRLELAARRAPSDAVQEAAQEAAEDDVGVRIELAAVRERLKKLEAIASGVEL